MKRREFIALVGGAAALPMVLPLTARGQRSAMPVVGYLMSRSAEDASHLAEAFRQGLRDSGSVDGQDFRVEYRWGNGQFDQLPAMAKELVQLPVAVLAATGGEPTAAAAKAATSIIPIVFGMSGDPVKMGLAESFNRPGRNATGVYVINTQIEPKRLGLLRDLVPEAKTVGVFINASFSPAAGQLRDLQQAAPQAGLELRVFRISADRDIDNAFEAIAKERLPALAVAASPYFDTRRTKLTALAEHYRVPTIFQFREYAVAGGLMSYGIDIATVHRQVGVYTGQILKGAKPADLPIMLPSKFEFVINLKTAKAIGLTIPPTLLARADEVIE
jgi:putative ABC transport system substrate-binding protein